MVQRVPRERTLTMLIVRLLAVVAMLLGICSTQADTRPGDAWLRAVQSRDVETLWRLLPETEDVNAAASRGKTALMVAAAAGDVELIDSLVGRGAEPDRRNHGEGTALMYSAQFGRVEAANALLAHGADVNLVGAKGWSALSLAVLKAHTAMVSSLIEHGADVNVPDMFGWTPLMRATEAGNQAVALILLEAPGIQVDAQSDDGTSALHVAAVFGRRDMVELLLRYGASSHLRDEAGNTPRTLAVQKGHQEVSALLDD